MNVVPIYVADNFCFRSYCHLVTLLKCLCERFIVVQKREIAEYGTEAVKELQTSDF